MATLRCYLYVIILPHTLLFLHVIWHVMNVSSIVLSTVHRLLVTKDLAILMAPDLGNSEAPRCVSSRFARNTAENVRYLAYFCPSKLKKRKQAKERFTKERLYTKERFFDPVKELQLKNIQPLWFSGRLMPSCTVLEDCRLLSDDDDTDDEESDSEAVLAFDEYTVSESESDNLYNMTLTAFLGPILHRSGCKLSDVSHTSGKN